jgi:DNA polymerase IV
MILHIDMDAFYAAVEQLDHPHLRGKCVIVGGTSNRGVVATASYEARRFGVRSAMPIFHARQLCPHAVVVPPRIDRYQEVSRQIMAILREFSPLVEPVSIDEAFLDLAGTARLHGAPVAMARAIKREILAAVHLTASVGVAPNRFLAKIASDVNKPDGLTVIAQEQVEAFIDRLPIGKVSGVGPKTQAKLEGMGVRHLGEVRKFEAQTLLAAFGTYGMRLMELAHGIDPTPVTPFAPGKSVSSECTLEADTRDMGALTRCLLAQAEEVASGLRKEGVKARTIVLKLKLADFKLLTRRTTFAAPTQSSQAIYHHAVALLEGHRIIQKIRLIGLGATGFVRADAPTQQELFGREKKPREGWEKVDRTLETIKNRFGQDVIKRGTLSED